MATDISTVKSTIVTESAIASTKGSTHKNDSGINFAEIIRNNGTRVEGGLNALSDKAGITGVSERSADSPATNDHFQDRADDSRDNSGNRANSDEPAERTTDRDASSQTDHNNDYNNERAQDTRPELADAPRNHSEDTQYTENAGETANADERPSETANHDDTATSEPAENDTAHAANSDNDAKGTVQGDADNTSNTVSKAETGNDGAIGANAAQVLNSLLSNSTGTTTAGKANASATDGLQSAIANVGKQSKSDGTNNGQSQSNASNSQTQTHNTPNNQAAAQAQSGANTETKTSDGSQAKEVTKSSEQAAQLSKMVGNGNKVDVSVSVTDERSTLVSKPSASLVSSSVVAADAETQTLRSKQGQGTNNTNGPAQAQQGAAQGAGVANQAQQSVSQTAAGQGQSANAAAIDAKGVAQAPLHSGGAQAAVSSGGEAPVASPPASTAGTQQSQQNTSAQAANANRFTTANPALTDQVSVQISKAISAGNDKISIQLKPADMGRVDVQMEVGHDGRVTAVVSADNKSTLDLLQKDAKELQQSLQQAGLQVDNDGLSFNLREQGEDGTMADNGANGNAAASDELAGNELSLEEELAGMSQDIITDSSIDVRA